MIYLFLLAQQLSDWGGGGLNGQWTPYIFVKKRKYFTLYLALSEKVALTSFLNTEISHPISLKRNRVHSIKINNENQFLNCNYALVFTG